MPIFSAALESRNVSNTSEIADHGCRQTLLYLK